MICETCEGEGYVRGVDTANPGALVMLPCLECNGSGVASCCDVAGSSAPPSWAEQQLAEAKAWREEMAALYHVPVDALFAEPHSSSRRSFVCPRCGAESFNTHDIIYRYCGRCHAFVDDPPGPS
jgi:ribosomal protein S27AE